MRWLCPALCPQGGTATEALTLAGTGSTVTGAGAGQGGRRAAPGSRAEGPWEACTRVALGRLALCEWEGGTEGRPRMR